MIPLQVLPHRTARRKKASRQRIDLLLLKLLAAKQAGMSIGHKGMLYAARCMAEGTKLLLKNPDKLTAAWEEFKNTDA